MSDIADRSGSVAAASLKSAVDQIYLARKQGHRVAEQLPAMSHRDALRIQLAVLDRFADDGDPAGGWKASYTSGQARDRMGPRFRPFGFISASRILASGSEVRLDLMANTAIEPELCLTIRHRLAGDVTYDAAFDAVESVRASFEINENRYPEGAADADVLAHGCGNWGIVLGEPAEPRFGLTGTSVDLFSDGKLQKSQTPHETMDDPYLSLARLSAELGLHGRSIEPGQHVITGSFSRSPVSAPGVWRARFGDIGDVAVRFV